jgi:hypothetical protein
MAAPSLNVKIQGQGSVSADDLNTYTMSCDTLAQLRAFSGAPGIQVYARGTTAIGDGGQGFFAWIAGGTGVDNNSTIIVPSGGGGIWQRMSTDSGAIISAAMTPVVQAATVALGRAALGSTTVGDALFVAANAAAAQAVLAQGPVLLQTQTVAGVATIDFVNGVGGAVIDATYNEYLFTLSGILPATNLQALQVRISTDSGATWKAGAGDYFYVRNTLSSAGTNTVSAVESTSSSVIASGNAGLSNNTGRPWGGEMRLIAPASALLPAHYADMSGYDGTHVFRDSSVWFYTVGTAINGVRFIMTAGNLSGAISLYGLRK